MPVATPVDDKNRSQVKKSSMCWRWRLCWIPTVVISLLLFAVIAIFFYPKEPKIELRGVEDLRIGQQEGEVRVFGNAIIKVTNPNRYSVNVKSVDLLLSSLSSDPFELDVKRNEATSLKGDDSSIVRLGFASDIGSVSSASSVLTQCTLEQEFRFQVTGEIVIDLLLVAVTIPINEEDLAESCSLI